MEFDFDKITDRTGTNAVKYDLAQERGKPLDALSLWVADMDFPTAPCIQEALAQKVRHGIYGYSRPDSRYYDALKKWFKERHDYEIEKDWVVNTPGVVFAINAAIRAFTKEGDGVLIQKPVYYPFFNSIKAQNRRVVNSALVMKDGRYQIDFEDFEEKVKGQGVKLFILCSPHNPGGRVWTRDELVRMNEICLKYGVLVVSDEIHSDLVFEAQHTVFGNLGQEAALNSIICTAPSKTFNLAGLQFSNIIIPDSRLRSEFKKQVELTGYDEPGLMGIVAAASAYGEGGEWFDAVKSYIWKNFEFARDYVAENCPKIKVLVPEGTYLLWMDFRELGLSDSELNDRILNKAKVWLDAGNMFGSEGEQFQRINCATPRAVLAEALERICREFKDI